MKSIVLFVLISACLCNTASAQASKSRKVEGLKYKLSDDGSKYIKASFLNQVWVRWNESNPGTTVNGKTTDNTIDIGLRRTRLQLFGQLSDHVFFYTQFGMNNFNYLSQNAGNRKLQAFFHDAWSEYKVFKNNNKLKIGGGLTVTNGLSRFTQPSIGTIMTTDVPVFLQATADQTDEFARKLSVYARGQLWKFDYRFALSDPFPIQTNGNVPPAINTDATFAAQGHTMQYQGFVAFNIFDREPHTTSFMTGTYLGKKKVLNLEAGAIFQQDATWRTSGVDTIYDAMLLWSVAAYADMPVIRNKYAISVYAGFFSTDYGKNYIRNNGIMNPANGNSMPTNFSGGGNAYPMFGTGSSFYTQAGLRLPEHMLGKSGTLMPYVSYRWSDYDKLFDYVNVFDAGLNWLIDGHITKLSLNYQLRPVFETKANGNIVQSSSANSVWVQYQVSF